MMYLSRMSNVVIAKRFWFRMLMVLDEGFGATLIRSARGEGYMLLAEGA